MKGNFLVESKTRKSGDKKTGKEFRAKIKHLAQKKQGAFEEFVRRYLPLASSIVNQRILQLDDREDMLQDFFLQFYEKNLFMQFRGQSEAEFKGFFVRILLHRIFRFYKSNPLKDSRLVSIEGASASLNLTNQRNAAYLDDVLFQSMLKKDTEESLNQAIDSLPEDLRDIVNLRLLGYSNREIAEILEKPKGTIDAQMAKALKILRSELEKASADYNTYAMAM